MTDAAKRDLVPDVLKLLACLGVIVIHVSSKGVSDVTVGTFDWFSATFWNSLARFCVPIFFMCTGALLLKPERDLPLSVLYRHYFLRILIVAMFWALIYGLFLVTGEYVVNGNYIEGAYRTCLFNVLRFNHHLHLYYLQILLLVYAFVPVLRVLTAHATRKELLYVLALWGAVGVVLPFLYRYLPFLWLSGLTWYYHLNLVYCCIGYALLGWFLRTVITEGTYAKWFLLAFLAGVALTFFGTVISSLQAGELCEDFLEGNDLGPMLEAAGLFGYCCCKLSGKGSTPRIAALVKQSFGVYLVHHFFVMIFITIGFDLTLMPTLLAVPVESAAVLLCSLLLCRLLSLLPFMRNYLL